MDLIINLTFFVTTLFYQQNTSFTVELKNTGSDTIKVPIPPMDKSVPIVHVKELSTGATRTYTYTLPPMYKPLTPGLLHPGQRHSLILDLFEFVPQLIPGEYEIRIAWTLAGKTDLIFSNPVSVNVLHSNAGNLSLANGSGGQADFKVGVWQDLASQPKSILMSQFVFSEGEGIGNMVKIIENDAPVVPVISEPPVGEIMNTPWVAWMENSQLRVINADELRGSTPVKKIDLNNPTLDITSPLFNKPADDMNSRDNGGALLFGDTGDPSVFEFLSVFLSEKNCGMLESKKLSGPKPVWIKNCFPSGNMRIAVFCQTLPDLFRVSSVFWPGTPGGEQHPVQLIEKKGHFLAADAEMTRDNRINGCILYRTLDDNGVYKHFINSWHTDLNGGKVSDNDIDIEWNPTQKVVFAKAYINDAGEPCVLIQDQSNKWHVYYQHQITPVPFLFETTALPIEIGFMDGKGEPLLICASPHMGFSIIQLDGSPLPGRRRAK